MERFLTKHRRIRLFYPRNSDFIPMTGGILTNLSYFCELERYFNGEKIYTYEKKLSEAYYAG